ncbi:MAG: zinc ribbon domain-containing protein [Bacteroidaceae bacterium]|nr:zinc ribbon domain-containing protein [Bacteroidaceae bacterium]
MPYCVKCGQKVYAGAAFCTACGTPMPNGTSAAPSSSMRTSASPNPPVPPSPQTPTPPPSPQAPPPPPAPGSQPGAFRVQMMRYKEATQPPQYSTTPPPSFVQQQQAQRRRSAQRRSGSSFGGCFRRGFHILTAAIAMIASLSWGIKSAFPNLNLNFFQGGIPGILSSCSGGEKGAGGLLGGSKNSFEGTLLGKEGYERAIDDALALDILTEMGVADKLTGVDHTLAFGTYKIAYSEQEMDMEGHTVAFRFDPPTSDDKRILANFVMLGDGKEVKKGFVGYGGSTLFIIYDDLEDVGSKRKPDLVVCANADGKSFSVYEKGKEMLRMELE